MSLEPIPRKVIPGFRSLKGWLTSVSEFYERLATNGLVPPQALDVEKSMLGALMIDRNAAATIIEQIGTRTIEDSPFYREQHTHIYRAACALEEKGKEVDLLSLTNQLRKDGRLEQVGGPSYLVELTSDVVTTANVASHARIVLEKHTARELIKMCEEMKLRAFLGEDETTELVEHTVSQATVLLDAQHKDKRTFVKTSAGTRDTMDWLSGTRGRKDSLVGVSMGLKDLNFVTTGWPKGELWILGARPGQGKTAAALQFARNAVKMIENMMKMVPVAYFSLEMSIRMLVLRLLCAEAGLNMQNVRKGWITEPEWRRLVRAADTLRSVPLYIDETPAITKEQVARKLKKLKRHEPELELAFIDHLGLMGVSKQQRSSQPRERDIAEITGFLLALAKDLDICIVGLSQLNRNVENRKGSRPQLSDLRDSGAIEQDARGVIFVYRPETYGVTLSDFGNTNTEGMMEFIVAKQSNGPLEDVKAKFEKHTGRIYDWDQIVFPDQSKEYGDEEELAF